MLESEDLAAMIGGIKILVQIQHLQGLIKIKMKISFSKVAINLISITKRSNYLEELK